LAIQSFPSSSTIFLASWTSSSCLSSVTPSLRSLDRAVRSATTLSKGWSLLNSARYPLTTSLRGTHNACVSALIDSVPCFLALALAFWILASALTYLATLRALSASSLGDLTTGSLRSPPVFEAGRRLLLPRIASDGPEDETGVGDVDILIKEALRALGRPRTGTSTSIVTRITVGRWRIADAGKHRTKEDATGIMMETRGTATINDRSRIGVMLAQ
jgi:hypothetical protein